MIRLMFWSFVGAAAIQLVIHGVYLLGKWNPMYPALLVGCLVAWWGYMIASYGFPWKRPKN